MGGSKEAILRLLFKGLITQSICLGIHRIRRGGKNGAVNKGYGHGDVKEESEGMARNRVSRGEQLFLLWLRLVVMWGTVAGRHAVGWMWWRSIC